MSAKVLLTELRKKFTKGIYLDFGSALDLICTKKDSRGYSNYDSVENLYNELLPSNWNDSAFENIYKSAKTNLGLHLSSTPRGSPIAKTPIGEPAKMQNIFLGKMFSLRK
jgi:hypothetical protein